MAEPPRLWEPTPEAVQQTALARFAQRVRAEDAAIGDDYESLWRWSVGDVESFWREIWREFDVQADGVPDVVLRSREMPGASWFPGVNLNYAEHVFRDRDDDALAIQFATERRPLAAWTWGELRDQVARVASGLRRLGVEPGDRVVAYMPNGPEAVAALLACASLGAIWSSCSPDFGVRAAIDRFAQIEPKVLLAVTGYSYGGRVHDRCSVVEEIRRSLPTLTHAVTLASADEDGGVTGTMDWAELVSAAEPLTFKRVPFEHPLWVLYSSGTTGLPKAIVHGHGGMLLEHLKLAHLHLDARDGDRVFWFATTGWMMWNLLVGVLLTRASIVLYDGNPGHPDMGALWDLADEAQTTIFGTSAAYISASMKADVHPAHERDLRSLRAVGSTGSPLSPEGFAWVYRELGAVWLFSTSGGTDMCTAFVGGVPTLPVHEGELQARALGAKVEAWDADGRALTDQVGELVITEPMPCMPVGFWGDADGSRYASAYFDHYPGVWRHGDWIEITTRGTAVIHGRSDATINRGGIRMGTSEIYRSVLAFEEIVDALVVDLPSPGTDGLIVLFVVLRDGATLDEVLRAAVASRLRSECSPRHVPNEIRAVPAVPRTLSGKVLEVPVKRILMGAPPDQVVDRDSLAHPSALDPFIAMAPRGAGRPA